MMPLRIIASSDVPMIKQGYVEMEIGFSTMHRFEPVLYSQDITMREVPNSRRKMKWLESRINEEWDTYIDRVAAEMRQSGRLPVFDERNGRRALYEEREHGKAPVRYNGDLARFEGIGYGDGKAEISWSREEYAAHNTTKGLYLQRSRRALPMTACGVLTCKKDGKEVIVVEERDSIDTDGSDPVLFVPAGYLECTSIGVLNPVETVAKELEEELAGVSADADKLMAFSLIHSLQNHEMVTMVHVPASSDFSGIRSGKGTGRLRVIGTGYQGAVDDAKEIYLLGKQNGLLVGGIVDFIGYRYGAKAREQALADIVGW